MTTPLFLNGDEVAARLPWDELIAAIEQAVANPDAHAPERTVHEVAVTGRQNASLLLKPAWTVGHTIVVKAVTFFGDNGASGLPTVNAGVLVFDGVNGTLLGGCDGNELTARRTAAASAAAAKRLVRPEARRLLVVGTGALAPMVAQAHAAVRDYDTIEIWGRDPAKAHRVAAAVADCATMVCAVDELDAAVAVADTISCVTASTEPLVRGAHLADGAHLDLIGSFRPDMRESDDAAIIRGDVWVDTYHDAVVAGDVAQPLASGVLSLGEINGDLAELVTGGCQGRTSDDQITVFKSAGTALADMAAASLLFPA